MIVRTLFTAALFVRLAALVAAVPYFPRAQSCVATITATVTVAPAATSRAATFSSPNGIPQPVTVTVTKTVVSTQAITQTRTVIQTVTHTSIQTVNNNAYGNVNGQQAGLATAVTLLSTQVSVKAISTPSSTRTGIPLTPSVRPYYGNVTGSESYLNSSNSGHPAPSSQINSFSIRSYSPVSTATTPAASQQGSSSTPLSSSSISSYSSGYENTLYFANWAIYGANYQPQSLPASSVTRINYAFANINSDGSVVSSDSWADVQKHYTTDSWNDNGTNAYGCVKQLYLLKKQNRNLKVLLSIGGWTYSSKFSPVAADPTMRQNFASSAVKLVTDWGFDGVDIDWEFNAYAATADDTKNIVLLLQAVRNAFDAWSAAHAPGYHFLITVASPAGPAVYGLWDMPSMNPYIDSWNLMAYDYAGSWSSASAHQANVYFNAQNTNTTPYSTDQAVAAYVAKGVPASKIIMGLPLYGRSFEGTAGLGQSYGGVGAGDTLGAGQWRFSDLPRAGATEYFDDVAKAAYSYDAATEEFISYDNVQSTKVKSAYLISRGLGGAMFWEASDDKSGTQSLVVTMAGQLGRLDSATNLLQYPTSQYDNIRNGMPGS